MKIGIGSDGSGYGLKGIIVDHLIASGHEVVDYGPGEGEQPEYSATYARKVAHAIRDGEVERGVLICGTGIGISISANKVRGIRAAVCSEPFTARHTRENNGSQIIACGAFVGGPEMAKAIASLMDAPAKRRAMSEFGMNRVRNQLAWQYSIPPLLAAYDKAFTLKKPAPTQVETSPK